MFLRRRVNTARTLPDKPRLETHPEVGNLICVRNYFLNQNTMTSNDSHKKMKTPARKPIEETIVINGDVYVKEPDKDFLFVAIYKNAFKQRRVTMEWFPKYQQWCIELTGRFLFVENLSEPIFVDDKIIPTYLTERQSEILGEVITETLLKISK